MQRPDLLRGPSESLHVRSRGHPLAGLVGQEHHTCGEAPRTDEVHGLEVGVVAEQSLAAAQDHREDHQPIFVHEVVPDEGGDQVRAAVDHDIAAYLLLELPHFAVHVTAQDGGVAPFDRPERARDHVLGDLVHEPSEVVVLRRRPEEGEDQVGRPTKQDRARVADLLELVLLRLLVLPPQRPGIPPGPMLLEPRRLHDAIERHELRHDQPPHPAEAT